MAQLKNNVKKFLLEYCLQIQKILQQTKFRQKTFFNCLLNLAKSLYKKNKLKQDNKLFMLTKSNLQWKL